MSRATNLEPRPKPSQEAKPKIKAQNLQDRDQRTKKYKFQGPPDPAQVLVLRPTLNAKYLYDYNFHPITKLLL